MSSFDKFTKLLKIGAETTSWTFIGCMAGVAGPMLGCFYFGPLFRRLILRKQPMCPGDDPKTVWGMMIMATMPIGGLISGVESVSCLLRKRDKRF